MKTFVVFLFSIHIVVESVWQNPGFCGTYECPEYTLDEQGKVSFCLYVLVMKNNPPNNVSSKSYDEFVFVYKSIFVMKLNCTSIIDRESNQK